MAERVAGPDGRTWTIRRRWIPRLGNETLWGRFHRRFRQTVRRMSDAADADPGCAADIGEGIVVVIGVVLIALVLFFVAVPLVIALVEIVGLILLALATLAGRTLLGRPWIIEAAADDGTCLTWRVVGFRAGTERCREIASMLEAGVTPPEARTPG